MTYHKPHYSSGYWKMAAEASQRRSEQRRREPKPNPHPFPESALEWFGAAAAALMILSLLYLLSIIL